MRTNLPPANVTCTTGFRRRCADPLQGSGALAHQDRVTSSSRRPAGTAADPAGEPANRVVIVEFSPHVPVAPRAEPRRATQTQDPAALGCVQGLGPQAPAQATAAPGRVCLGRP